MVKKQNKRKLSLPVAISTFLLTNVTAFADDPATTPVVGEEAIKTIFGVLGGVASAVQTGLTSVVGPIAIAVCLFFLVRMLLASEPRDVAMYKKRCITTAVIVVIAFAIPGLIKAMQTLGENVNGQL